MDKIVSSIKKATMSLNNSKFFAGIVMLLLNVGARHMTINLSKTQEDFLRYNVAKELVIFAMAWVGTRDLVTSLLVTSAFVVLADYLLNEDSRFCIIPEKVIEHHRLIHSRINPEDDVSPEEERKAIETLEKVNKKKRMEAQVAYVNALQRHNMS
jgi:hypothetical protein